MDPMDQDWLDSFLEDPVLNDRMITDALQPPHIQSEHSYSLSNSETDVPIKTEPVDKGRLRKMKYEINKLDQPHSHWITPGN